MRKKIEKIGAIDATETTLRARPRKRSFRIVPGSGFSPDYRHEVSGKPVIFKGGLLETIDPEIVAALSACRFCVEVK